MLKGIAVGDALGAPVEGHHPRQIASAYHGLLTEMVGLPAFGMPLGTITDDTSMTAALARSLVKKGTFDPEDVLRHYLLWHDENPLGIGSTVDAVLTAIGAGASPHAATAAQHEATGGLSAGNGALMRSAPLAALYARDLVALRRAARADAALTHHGFLPGDCSEAWCEVLAACLSGADPEPALEGARDIAGETSAEAVARRALVQPSFSLTTLAVGCAAAVREDFEEGVVWAVNLGGDADTNGAVAGAVLGARLGEGAIPVRWTAQLDEALLEELRCLADGLCDAATQAEPVA
jgi:ADP-ribosyl-[dinitrogen reductase] hydrolase